MRDELNKMIEWYIGQKTEFSVSAGKNGKHFKLYLDERQYGMLCSTYAGIASKEIWATLFEMCGLFRELAFEVAGFNSFTYPLGDDKNMSLYLQQIRRHGHVNERFNSYGSCRIFEK